MHVLGIETSCDETGVAIVGLRQGKARVLGQALHSQVQMHRAYGGVVPELASRDHISRVLPLIEASLAQAGLEREAIDAIAVTAGPGLAGALLVGTSIGHALGLALGKPVLDIHHLEGHLVSPLLAEPAPELPYVALLVSGGHTQLLHAQQPGQYVLLGETLDDAAGEAFDKTAMLLGLGYPGGPAVSRLAEFGTPGAIDLPRPLLKSGQLNFSFSGLKTAVALAAQKPENNCEQARADIARAFVDAVVEVLTTKSMAALRATGLKGLVVAGGVGANVQLRVALADAAKPLGAQVYFPPLALCTDNGAMIALAGWLRLMRGETHRSLAFDVRPRWPIADLRPHNPQAQGN